MNARTIVVGFVLSLSLSLACDEPQECEPSKVPYMPCDAGCEQAQSGDVETCSRMQLVEICAPTCAVDADCPLFEIGDGGWTASCVAGSCSFACDSSADCPNGLMACFEGTCMWGRLQ